MNHNNGRYTVFTIELAIFTYTLLYALGKTLISVLLMNYTILPIV